MTDRRRLHRPLSLAAAAIVATIGTRAIAQNDPTDRGVIDDRRRVAADAKKPPAEDPTAGVFVRDSATAADKLALAERMEKARQWDTSADVYQEVLDGFPDRVVPTHTDAKGRADRYGSVGAVVQDRISAWPAAGLQVYVARHANAAREMLDAAPTPDDRTTLARVVSRYFATDAGRDAALRLVEIYFDRGEFVASATLADRLLDRHPNLDDASVPNAPLRPLLLARAAITWRLAGEDARAAQRGKTLSDSFADARATIAGTDGKLVDLVAAELARPRVAPAALTGAADAWQQPFGSDDHAVVAAEPKGVDVRTPREWARLQTFPVESPPANANREMVDALNPFRRQRELGVSTGILPSVADGVLYFQDNVAVQVYDLATGKPPAGWAQTYPESGRFRMAGATPTPRGAQLGVTIAGDRVLAILGQTDALTRAGNLMNNGDAGRAVGGARVVCLDRESGKLIWQASPAGTVAAGADGESDAARAQAMSDAWRRNARPMPAGPINNAVARRNAEEARRANPVADVQAQQAAVAQDAAADAKPADAADDAVRASEPCGSVVVANDSVYVVTRGLRSGGFQDVYLCCFALDDGSLRWARHLASGNPPMAANFDEASVVGDVADSHLAYADGRVVVCTDLGAIASVDAADGTIGWLTLYPRPRAAAPNMGGFVNPDLAANGRVAPAYSGNPVVVRDGRVVTLPVDGESLFVHDAATGRPIARVAMRRRIEQRTDRIDVLAGLNGDRLVLASSAAITVLDYAKLLAGLAPDAPERVASVDDVLVNYRPVVSPAYPDTPIRGRPFLTEGSLYVSTAQRLFRLTADARRVLDRYPAGDEDLDARREESPGNVVAIDGSVIVAGSDGVSVYAEMSQLRKRLDAAIAAEPRAVRPRIDYAVAMFDTDRRDEALKWIDAAIEQLNNPGGLPTPGPVRDEIFTACMTMLRRLDPPRADVEGDANDGDGRATPTAAPRESMLAESTRPFAAALVDRAMKLADPPYQQVSARLARASIARRSGDNATAVDAYQSLLEETAWSALNVRSEGGDANAAGVPLKALARQAIDVILKSDADAYAAVERRAAAAVEAERQRGGGLSALFEIIDRYPNAKAARDAMVLAAARVAAAAPGAAPKPSELRRLGAQLVDASQRATLNRTLYALASAGGDVEAGLGRARRVAQLDGGTLPAWPTGAATAPAAESASAGDAVDRPAAEVVAQLQRLSFDAEERRLPDLRADLSNVPSFAIDRVQTVEKIAQILVPPAGPGARGDRLLAVRRDDRKLLIFAPGRAAPLQEIAVPGLIDNAQPTWRGDRVYLSQPGRMACVDAAAGRVLWVREAASLAGGDAAMAEGSAAAAARTATDTVRIAASLAPAGVSLVGAADGVAVANGPDEDLARAEARLQAMLMRANNEQMLRALVRERQVLNQRRMIVQQQNRVIRLNGMNADVQVAPGWLADAPDGGGPETIAQSRVLGDGGAVVATTRGRIVGLGADGATRWQTWLTSDRAAATNRAPAFLDVAGGDQVVVAGTDERTSRLVVLDAADGRETMRREFAASDARQRIVNVATSPGGLLAVVQADGLIVWDAGDGSREPLGTWRGKATPGDDGSGMTFVTSTGPRHVAFCGDKLLAVASTGNEPHVRVFDALTAQPARTGDPNTGAERRLPVPFARERREGDEPVALRVHRDRVLIDTGAAMASVNVLDAQPAWSRALPDVPTALSPQSPMLVRGGLLVIGWPKDVVGQTSAQATLELYSRETLANGREVGMAVDELPLGKLAGTNADARVDKRQRRQSTGPRLFDRFQVVDGGIYMLTNAGRLTFLPGANAK